MIEGEACLQTPSPVDVVLVEVLEVDELAVVVDAEVVVVSDPPAITAVWACSPLPRTVTMYFWPVVTGCVGN